MKEKKDLAKGLGTGGANKAANALMSREAKIKAALEEAEGVTPSNDHADQETPKEDADEFSQAVSMVRKATKKPGGATTRSNFA
jgi:hypothetical protein